VAKSRSRRVIIYVGLALYATSFFLIAVTNAPAYGGTFRGYHCAWLAFGLPWGENLFGHQGLFEHRKLEYLAVLLSGWINPLFLMSALFVPRTSSVRGSLILAMVPFAMVPFCWVVFYYNDLYPREGHFIWIAAMVLVLCDRLNPATRS
jgi:hypothetical protein